MVLHDLVLVVGTTTVDVDGPFGYISEAQNDDPVGARERTVYAEGTSQAARAT
jgi:hypothetical protein